MDQLGGQYSRGGRRNYYIGTTGVDTFVTMNFSTDFNEKISYLVEIKT